MSGSNRIAITISAVDGASKKLEEINKRLAAMTAPVTRLTKSFDRFSDASGITKLSKGFQDLGRGSLDAYRNISRVVDPLAAITGAASTAGMVKLTTAWADFGSQLGFSAQRLGITAASLQTFQGAAALAGSSSSALSSGMQALGQNMWNAVGGRSPETVATFKMLHLGFQQVGGSAKSVADMMPLIADKIKSIQNPFAQAAVATALFGGAGQDLLPLLRLGSAGMADYERHAKAYGVFTAAGVTAANNLRMAQVDLTLSVQGLGNAIAQRLAPVMLPMINGLALWISNNRGLIAQDVTGFVEKLSQRLPLLGKEIQGVVNLFGGWEKAGGDLLVFMGGAWLAGMLAPLVTIGTALAGITASLGLLPALAGVAAGAALIAFRPSLSGATAAGAYSVVNGHPVFIPTTNQISETVGSYHKVGNRSVYGQMPSAAASVRSQGMAYFTRQGWSAAHAAAIMGNVQAESSFDPNAYSYDARTGAHRGLFQDDATRWAALTAWAKTSNPSAAQQFQFAQMELMTNQAAVARALHASQGAADGAMAFDSGFERSGDSYAQMLSRGANAAYILSASGPAANIGNGSGSTQVAPAGVVTVNVNHANAPAGTTTTAKATGPGVKIGTLKISRAMAGGSL